MYLSFFVLAATVCLTGLSLVPDQVSYQYNESVTLDLGLVHNYCKPRLFNLEGEAHWIIVVAINLAWWVKHSPVT